MAYNYYNNPYAYQAQAQPQMQIQNSGFVPVRNEQEARSYPVAPGNSVTFKDETVPYIYTKTMGFSQLDRPSFEKYKLIKEEVSEETSPTDVVQKFETEIKKLWEEVNTLKKSKKEVNFDA